MSTHILENERLRVAVADAGAELVSVYDKEGGLERIWNADPAVWNRHAPILFPFVGKVINGQYRFGDRSYAMKTQHGFARDKVFDCLEESSTAVRHVLTATRETRAIYPWAFRLTVGHRLEGRKLFIDWTVENLDRERMYFCIGGHPGFMMPKGVNKEDCFLAFPGVEALRYIGADSAGFALPAEKALPLKDGLARYQADIPDTWIFEDHQVRAVGIATPDGRPWVTLSCEQFPMLAVWANPAGPFICLEPWFGRTDDAGFSGTVDQKKDIQLLEPGARQDIGYSIEFHL